MALKPKICSLLKVLGIHPFDCERCNFEDCEGRYMRERLQELSRDSTANPDAEDNPPANDNVA